MRDDPDAVMLFAAGHGTRMQPLTLTRPKALVRVAGQALIDRALDLADAAGIARKVVNTHAHADQLRDHLAARSDVALSHEPSLLETGGGLRAALPLLGQGAVFTANTDAIWTGANPFDQLRAAWRPDQMDALLLLVPITRAVGYTRDGDFTRLEDGRITRSGPLVYTGAQILRTDGLAAVPDEAFSLTVLWQAIAAKDRLFGLVHTGGWADVGTVAGIQQAETLLEDGHV